MQTLLLAAALAVGSLVTPTLAKSGPPAVTGSCCIMHTAPDPHGCCSMCPTCCETKSCAKSCCELALCLTRPACCHSN
jgi:hypothetical protein